MKSVDAIKTVRGRVITGESIGTEIGYPTANLDYRLIERRNIRHGVWACSVRLRGKEFHAVAILGVPFARAKDRKKFEVHILDWNGILYGEEIDVKFIAFIRELEKYHSSRELVRAIEQDLREARSILNGNVPLTRR